MRRLGVGLVVLLAVLSGLLFKAPQSAQAVSTYSYTDGTSVCTTSSPSLAISETSPTQTGGTLTYIWCYQNSTSYEFARSGSSDRISVASSTPGQGTLVSAGQSSNIAISNDAAFAQAFQTTTTTANSNQPESCESIGNWAWLACPLVNMMSSAIGWLDERIQGLLEVGEDRYANPKLRDAWVNFRNLAFAVLLPIMLIMVISTSLGFEMFSAYTIKKALPRMGVAIVFIALSWHITTFLVGFSNVVGSGVLGLITSPFGIENGMSLNTLFGASSSNAGDVASTAGSAAVQWAATLGPLVGLIAFAASPGGLVILLLYLVPVVAFILLAFVVLLMREIFIFAGILVAPLAILSWIFPGNDKLWKSWWGLFSKLLMMFPLIMIVIGAGRIAAYMIDVSGGGGLQSLVNPLLKLTAYVLPYLFIPFTFRYAGGIFANLAGMVNDREKGILDRFKKSRGEKVAEYAHRAGINSIFDQRRAKNTRGFNGWRMRATNTVGGWLFDPINNAHVALGTEKGRAIISQVNKGRSEDSQKLSELLAKMGFNAEELSSLSLGRMGKNADGSKFWIRAWNGTAGDLDRISDQLMSSVDEQDRIGGRHLRANAQLLTQITRNEEYSRADFKVAAGLAYAAQGFATPEEIARLASEADGYEYEAVPIRAADGSIKEMGFRLVNAGNSPSGLGGIVKTNAELLAARAGGLGKPGYGVRLGADGQYYATSTELLETRVINNVETKIYSGAKIEQLIRTGVQDLSAAKGGQLSKQLEDTIQLVLTDSGNSKYVMADGQLNDIAKVRTGVEETLVQVMGSYAAPDVKRRVYNMLVEAKKQTLIGTSRNVKTVDATGNPIVSTVTITPDNVEEYAEADIQALLRRSSGAIDPAKLGLASDEENKK